MTKSRTARAEYPTGRANARPTINSAYSAHSSEPVGAIRGAPPVAIPAADARDRTRSNIDSEEVAAFEYTIGANCSNCSKKLTLT